MADTSYSLDRRSHSCLLLQRQQPYWRYCSTLSGDGDKDLAAVAADLVFHRTCIIRLLDHHQRRSIHVAGPSRRMGSLRSLVPCHVSLRGKSTICLGFADANQDEQDLQSPFGDRLYAYQATGIVQAQGIIGAFIGALVSFSIQE